MSKTKTDNVKASPELTHALDVLMRDANIAPCPLTFTDPGCNSDPFGFALMGILQGIDDTRAEVAAMERNPLAGDEHAIKLLRQDAAKALRALADEIEKGEVKK